MEGNYYLGLDMGTSSCGWSVTDEEYHVLRRHGKALWGVRLFEGAKTAEERRMHRTGRRRLDRRGWRINILQELFAEEVSKIDPGFFLRMKESKYYPEDKRDINGERPELPYALFVDPEFTDKDYHREFPTIYHLRKWLMETKEVPDIRLVYLALHHMIKHRGHFLLSGDIEQVKEFKNTFETFIQNVKDEELDFNLEITEEKISYIEEVLSNKNILKSTKKSRLVKELGARTKCEKAVITLLTGGTAKLSDIFANEELDENERPKISFADNGYDEYIDSVEAELGEQFYIIASAKAVYDWSVLTDILDGCTSISGAKIKEYEKHKADLRLLKKVVRENFSKDIYKKIFVVSDAKLANYPAYIGMTKVNGKKTALGGKQCSREDFLKYLNKTIVEKLPESEEKTYLKNEIETDQFLPRQVTKDNGVLPYQIHKYELQKILDNLSARIPVIAENKEKLIQLFTFRIPYYVGPLNKVKEENEQKYTWAVRKSEDKIYPWNFTDIIDVEASAEKFIKRMTNKCTYLIGEDVLPKDRYPISYTIQKERGGFWKSLLEGNFITKEKYERLVRKTELTLDELAGFIERQIVETRQSTKVVADLLKKAMPDSEIVYVKARSVSKFRQDYDFVKVRDMNDLHHAKDAYLNIVVGNAYYTKFTKNAVWFIKENPGRSYNLEKMFIHDISRNGKVAWKAGDKGTIKTVRNVMNKNNILVTRRSYEVKGGLFDQQIMKKGKGQVPVKTSDERLHDINKYGGYNKAAGAYFMFIKSTDAKGNEQRTIEFVPIYKKDYIERSKENALEYLREIMKERKLSKPVILINKIKIDTLFKVDGFYMWLSGRTGNRLIFKGANELILSDEETKILKKVIKFTKRKMENKNVELTAFDGINEVELTHLYDVFVSKLQNTIYKIRLGLQASTLIDNKGKFENLNLEDKCTVLSEILHLFQCQSAAANLKLIGGPASAGILVMNNNIMKCKQISIINQSVTGIYKKEIDLLKL